MKISLKASKTSSRRWLLLVSFAVCLVAIIVAAVGYWQRRHFAAAVLPLADALWVTERDYSRYYAPGTPESRSVVRALVQQDASLVEQRFSSFVLYRRGLSETSPASETLLVFGFDPSAIPRQHLVPTR